MATSGSKDWGLTRDQIIEASLRKIGVYDSGDTVGATELTDATIALNALTKEWAAEEVGFWLHQRTVLILNQDVQEYKLGLSGTTGTTDNFHAYRDTQHLENKLSAAEAASQTVISISDNTASVDNWTDFNGRRATKPTSGNIGIRLSDGNIHWDTIAGVGADTVTLTTGLPATSGASSGAKVYAYTTRTYRPHGIVRAYRRDTAGNDTDVEIITRERYASLSLKNSSGVPLEIHFDPQITDASLFVWPQKNPSSLDKLVLITQHYPDDFDAAADDMEFPVEWGNALIWNLARELCYEYGVDRSLRGEINAIAEEKKNIVFTFANQEPREIRFISDNSPRIP